MTIWQYDYVDRKVSNRVSPMVPSLSYFPIMVDTLFLKMYLN